MAKGEDTKRAILDAGMDMAGELGFEGVSIGALAKSTGLSKSGLFAHFQSKENLLIEILNHAAHLFSENVVVPALKTEAGIPRIHALVNHWIKWSARLTGGCLFVTASTEYSDRPGKIRSCLLKQQNDWIDCLSRIAQAAARVGDFRRDIDCKQFAFDLYSLLLGFHYYDHLLHDKNTLTRQEESLDRLLSHYRQKKREGSPSSLV